MKKRGSHVGIVLSFIIFVGFVYFVFVVVQPKLRLFGESNEKFLDYLRIELLKQFNENITTVSINTTRFGPNCIELINFLPEAGINSQIIVKNESGAISDIRVISETNLQINRARNSNRLFKVYYSNEFNESGTNSINPCLDLDIDEEYSIGKINTEMYAFESKINRSISEYSTSYSALKRKLNLPADVEFGFNFKNMEGYIIQPGYNVAGMQNVYASEISILYVDRFANIQPGFLTILVW